MAFGKKKSTTSVLTTLGTKQAELLDAAQEKNATAAAYVQQANALTSEAATHQKHAEAFAQAYDILDKAGVTL